MDIYIIAMVLSCLLAMILNRAHSKGGILTEQAIHYMPTFTHAFFAMVPLAFVALFRWDVGTDSLYGSSYYTAYIAAKESLNDREFEWGFFALSSLMSRLNIPYFWYLFILTAFYMVAISYGIQKISVSPVLSILVFVLTKSYFDSFSALRQAMSQAVCIIAVAQWMSGKEPESTRKQDRTFIITILLASLLHVSALMYIPMFLFSRRSVGLRNLIIITGFCLLGTPVLQIVFRFVGSLVKEGLYQPYGFGAISYILLSLLVFVLCLWKYYDILALNPRACLLINHAMVTFIMMLNSSALIQPYRIFDALKIFFILTVPYVVKSFKSRTLGFFIALGILGVVGYFYYNSMYLSESIFLEYHSVFEDWSYYTMLP